MRRQTTRSILFTTLAVIVALATGGAALAFNAPPSAPTPPTPPGNATVARAAAALPGCDVSYTNGSGIHELSWCRSVDGNITQLEHGAGISHLAAGSGFEGWCVSAEGSIRGATDGSGTNFGLGSPSYPHPTKVRHNTSDGSLRIESRFSTSPGNKQIVVKMNIRNNGSEPLDDVFITRFIDADIANNGADDTWTSSARSVTAGTPGVSTLQLFPKTVAYDAASFIFEDGDPFDEIDPFCYGPAAVDVVEATASDRSMGVLYFLGTIQPGHTVTVEYMYRISF